ncbi:MAG TPA: AtpZ/AtpI family protein [Moheibacter sp.]|nr:AtpZ/AtpI family protein [Moheibacter sp.]
MTKKQNHTKLSKYIQLTGIGFQMMAVIFAFVWLGRYGDDHYQFDKKYLTALGSLLGLIASLYLVLKQLKNIQ